MRDFDVVVVGAGIVGCACALECVRCGLRCGIVEVAVPGGAATAAGMGHVVAMDDSAAQLVLTRYSQRVWQELAPMLPRAAEYEQRGTLWIAVDEEELAEVHRKRRVYGEHGIETEVLDGDALAELEPNLRRGLAGALLVPEDAVIYPPAAAGYFLREAEREGAVLLRGSRVIKAGHGRVTLEDGERLGGGCVIVATGGDDRLLPRLPIRARKGHLVITDIYPGFVSHQLVELGYLKSAHASTADSVAFNLQPRQTGQLLIGSSRQFGCSDAGVEAAMVERMVARAEEYMPGLAQLSALRIWTGFRAATPDKLPYIGPTEDATVFAAMGFEGLGITNAPGAARLVIDQILGRESAIDRAPYLPDRVFCTEATHA